MSFLVCSMVALRFSFILSAGSVMVSFCFYIEKHCLLCSVRLKSI